eukprot:m51a1_g1877 putative phosphatase tensin type domain-containing protein (371) ;mRNA; f:680092-681837
MELASKARSLLRELVSADRHRYVDGRFDLDLCYITDRVIAMSCPMQGLYSTWRNSSLDVAEFLSQRHGDNYTIWDLTLESPYDSAVFGHRVRRCGFADHHAPPLALLWRIVREVEDWLAADERNVAALHCMAGKGRTGTVIAAFLVHSHASPDADSALNHFAYRRSREGNPLTCATTNRNGVASGSQKRYVWYMEQITKGLVAWSPESSRCVVLRSVTFHRAPPGFAPRIELVELAYPHRLLCPARPCGRQAGAAGVVSVPVLAQVDGDVMVRVFEESSSGERVYALRFALNTHFATPGYRYRFAKSQMDGAVTGGLRDDRLAQSFAAEVEFSEAPTSPGATAEACASARPLSPPAVDRAAKPRYTIARL